MRSTLKTFIILSLLTAAGGAAAMQSTPGSGLENGALLRSERTELDANQRGCMTLSQAVEQVKRQYKGRIVSAKTVMRGNQEVHEIKVLLDDGKVKTVRVPGCRRN